MAVLVVRGIDLLAVGAAAVASAMTVVYRDVVQAQGDGSPLWWVQAVLLAGALLALAGAPLRTRRRTPVLASSAGLLGVVGLLGILTIGLPVLAAAALALVAAVRAPAPAEQPAGGR